MSRLIKDIKDKNTGQLVYPRTHLSAVVVDETTNLENLIGTNVGSRLNQLETTIKTDGSGEKYLSDDGTYQTLDLSGKQDIISDLEDIRSGAALGTTSVQPNSLSTVATSGSYSDLSNKPTIDTFQTKTGTTQTISSFPANTVYSCTASGNTTKITISGFANPTPETRAAYYTIVFKATSCTFTVPSTVMWVGGNAIEFDSGTAYTYEVNFMKIQLSEGVRYLATWNRY